MCKALANYTEKYKKTTPCYPLLCIDKPLIAASLYSMFIQAEADNIRLHFDIIKSHITSKLPEYELADCICILTQNAIEACHDGDHIYIHMDSYDGMISADCVYFAEKNWMVFELVI